MNKLFAVMLCSGALMGAPAVFAQATGNNSGNGGGGAPQASTDHPPLTPSQTETSQGAIVNPPPLDRSGDPEHVSEKEGATGNGAGASGAAAGGSGAAPGTGGQDGGATAAGNAGASGTGGTGTGTGAGSGSGAGTN